MCFFKKKEFIISTASPNINNQSDIDISFLCKIPKSLLK